MDKNSNNVALALLTGATVGAMISILYAPARGSDLRRRISDGAEQTAEALLKAAEQLKRNVSDTYLEEKDTLETRLDRLFSHAQHRSEELIPLLEQKLDDLKKKGRKLPNAKKT